MDSDPDKIFDTREEAERARDRLNAKRPEWGYSPWYLGACEDKWSVVRARGAIAEDLDCEAREYEQKYCAAVERTAMHHDYWIKTMGIRFESVALEGRYPDTQPIDIFRSVACTDFGVADLRCRFGTRWPIWPAEYTDAEREADFHDVYFMEFLGTNPTAYGPVRIGPCDPNGINWLS